MTRLEAFNYFINNFSGILEYFLSKHEKRISDNSKLKNTYSSYLFDENVGEDLCLLARNSIINLIKKNESMISSNYSEKQINDYIFLLSSISDEIIINESKKDIWGNYLIERTLFQTSISGEQIINKIKEHNKSHSVKDQEMSEIYYYIFCIGYKGMYKSDLKSLINLKHETFTVMANNLSISIKRKKEKLSSSNYQYVLKTIRTNNYYDYSFIYKNIITIILFFQIIYVLYVWFFYTKFKLSKIL